MANGEIVRGAPRPRFGSSDSELSRLRAPLVWLGNAALAALALWMAWRIAADVLVRPHRNSLVVMPDVLRIVGASMLLFGVCGHGVTRLVLPERLRSHELLWVFPIGACTSAIALTVLGFLDVPFTVSLGLVLVAGVALSIAVTRRRGAGMRPRIELGWPVYVAILTVAIAIVPMASLRYMTVTGTGADAHLAAGTAQFLQHSYPTSVNVHEPVNQVPLTWRSKYPIYYAFAAVAELAGLQTFQVLTTLEGVMLALAAVGIYLLARELLLVGLIGGVCAMLLVTLDRVVLHTALNPYYNQTWGWFAFPFALVLAGAIFSRGEPRDPVVLHAGAGAGAPPPAGGRLSGRGGAVLLLVLFLAVLAFAYPLALPIPLVALVVPWVADRRERMRGSAPVVRLRDRLRGTRRRLWMPVIAFALLIPAYGVYEKIRSGVNLLAPGTSLAHWGGDLGHFLPAYQFFGVSSGVLLWPALVLFAGLAFVALRELERPLAWGLALLVIIGLAFAAYFRARAYGWYFEFKILAFVAPLILVFAAAGAARLRRLGPVILALLVTTAWFGARDEVKATGFQLGQPTIDLSGWAASVPRGASIRLDMPAPMQLWAAYFLASRPLCSQTPLFYTDYPSVPYSRKADYVVVQNQVQRPPDAIGPALLANAGYHLYRLDPRIPGPDLCSLTRVPKIGLRRFGI